MRPNWLIKSAGILLAGLIAAAAPAAVVQHVLVLKPGEDDNSSDDSVVTDDLRWDHVDYQEAGLLVYILKPFGGGDQSIIPPAINGNAVLDDDILLGFRRAVNRWNDNSFSDFRFNPAAGTTEGLSTTELPFGPFQVQADRYNLISFSDPDITVADGVLYTPHIFYFAEDFDPDTSFNPSDHVTELTTGDIQVGFDTHVSLLELVLPPRRIEAGTIIDADVVMGEVGNDWHQYPENPGELPPEMNEEDTLGTFDIESAITQALGIIQGIGQSHMYAATMTPHYIVPGDADATFLTNPFEFRSLNRDDRIAAGLIYPSDNYKDAAGFEGSLLNGAAVDNDLGDDRNDTTVLNNTGVVGQIVYFGRGLGQDELFDLDTVFFGNTRLGGFTESTVGPIHLEAHVASGPDQEAPAAGGESAFPVNSPSFGVDRNGDYKIRGLETDDNWYIFVGQSEFGWDGPSTAEVGAATVPFEFLGGVLEPSHLPGRGDVVDTEDEFGNTLENKYLSMLLDVRPCFFIDANGNRVDTTCPSGQFNLSIRKGPSFLEFAERQFEMIRLIRQSDGAVFDFDNRGGGFGAFSGFFVFIDEDDNVAQEILVIQDGLGNELGQVLFQYELVSLPDHGVDEQRGWRVLWQYQNTSNTTFNVAWAKLYDPGYGAQSGVLSNIDVFVDGDLEEYSTLYGGSGDSMPDSIDWYDNPNAPRIKFSAFTAADFGGPAGPDEVLTCDSDQARFGSRNLFTMIPGASLTTFGGQVINTGFVMRWNPVEVPPGDSRTCISEGAFFVDGDLGGSALSKTLRDVENGFPKLNDFDRGGDDPLVAFHIPLGSGDHVKGADIITNTGDRPRFFGDDSDGDGIPDDQDNCPFIANPMQEDNNTDGRGDASSSDYDNDGVPDALDNCPNFPNEDQADSDGDGVGDACDDDADGDGVPNEIDNCRFVANPDQDDFDLDGVGDACEGDFDGDGIPDEVDNCPFTPNADQLDTDGDGLGDICDDDDDDDGALDTADNCPLTANQDQTDTDGDGIGDVCENVGFKLVDKSPDAVQDQSTAQLPRSTLSVNGAAAGDVNGDGYPDLVIANTALPQTSNAALGNRIYINRGAARPGFFDDLTYGVNGIPGDNDDRLSITQDVSDSCILFDFDLDGDLDLFVSNKGVLGQLGKEGPLRLYANRDENNLAINPFADTDSLGDGFFTDVSDLAFPGLLNSDIFYGGMIDSGNGDGDANPRTLSGRRCRVADIDCDGDMDIVVAVDNSWADLADSTWDVFLANERGPILYSERILINRREQLIDAEDRSLPIGTPDAFLNYAQYAPPSIVNVVLDQNPTPGDPFGRRLNARWFRDETLGGDGIFSFYSGEVGSLSDDRLPPLYPDFTSTVPIESDAISRTIEVGVADALHGSGVDIFVANLISNDLKIKFGAQDGYNPVYVNLDRDGDGIEDGYFFELNFAINDALPSAAIGPLVPGFLIGIKDGDPGAAVPPAETDELPFYTDHSTGVVEGDTGSTGRAVFSEITDNEGHFHNDPATGPSRSVTTYIRRATDRHGNVFTGSSGSLGIGQLVSPALGIQPLRPLAPGNQLDRYNPFAQDGRSRHAVNADLNRDGILDELVANDNPQGTPLVVASIGGGFLRIYIGITGFGDDVASDVSPTGFLEVSPAAISPPLVEDSYAYLATLDADLDGDIDLFAGVNNGQSHLYINQLYSRGAPPQLLDFDDADIFFDATTKSLGNAFATVADPTSPGGNKIFGGSSTGAAPGDFDRDGRQDLIVTAGGLLSQVGDTSVYYHNYGLGKTAASTTLTNAMSGYPAPRIVARGLSDGLGYGFGHGLNSGVQPSTSVAIADLDGDGDLDVLAANYGINSRFYLNRDANETAPPLFANTPISGLSAKFYNSLTNYDVDPRDPETFPPYVLGNTLLGDGILDDTTGQLPQFPPNDVRTFTNKVRVADLNNDGRPDIFLANALLTSGAPNVVLFNTRTDDEDPRTTRFVDVSEEVLPLLDLGGGNLFVQSDNTFDAALFDADNDGDIDILLGNHGRVNDTTSGRFVAEMQLLLNQGGLQGGAVGTFRKSVAFPPLKHQVRSVATGDFGRRGNVCEDINGDGIVSDTEILNYENMKSAIRRQTQGQVVAERTLDPEQFSPALVPVPLQVLADTGAPGASHRTLVRRAQRYLDLNRNGSLDRVLDVVVATETGLRYLSNDGFGGFEDQGDLSFVNPDPSPSYDISVGDIDLDGWLDFVTATRSTRLDPSARLLANVGSPGTPFFIDVTPVEVPFPITTVLDGLGSDPHGNPRAVSLFDIDGDADLDLYVGENGSTAGLEAYGALDAFYENRVNGASFAAPSNAAFQAPTNTSAPDTLSATLVAPSGVTTGTTADIRVYGNGFRGGATLLLGPGIHFAPGTAPIVRAANVIDATIQVDAFAVPGLRNVVVVNPSGDTARTPDYGGLIVVRATTPGTEPGTAPASVGPDWQLFN